MTDKIDVKFEIYSDTDKMLEEITNKYELPDKYKTNDPAKVSALAVHRWVMACKPGELDMEDSEGIKKAQGPEGRANRGRWRAQRANAVYNRRQNPETFSHQHQPEKNYTDFKLLSYLSYLSF